MWLALYADHFREALSMAHHVGLSAKQPCRHLQGTTLQGFSIVERKWGHLQISEQPCFFDSKQPCFCDQPSALPFISQQLFFTFPIYHRHLKPTGAHFPAFSVFPFDLYWHSIKPAENLIATLLMLSSFLSSNAHDLVGEPAMTPSITGMYSRIITKPL